MSIDLAYANIPFIPDGAAYPERWADDAQVWRQLQADIGRARLNLPYGAAERQSFDLFLPQGRPCGLLVFVHGGFWHKFHRSDWSHFSRGATLADWAVAIPSYTLAPEARISAITQEIAAAIHAAAAMVAGPIRLAGHSAGGQLVSRMAMATGPLEAAVLARVAHVVPISPVSDLRPLVPLQMNNALRLDPPEAAAESPTLHRPYPGLPVTVWVGAEERPAFLDQARWQAEAWSAPLRIAPGCHHFDILDGLESPDAPLTRNLLGL
ncbi:alpha/beta hydrolase [Pseudoruegeria sp. SK021]|uniref:alpha/beta hydrolase n=1 Tax=Pseudoruegeria sp. SK021 TaxID=1933035 RepID=UPI000A247B1C|nr:alpha/beta hydrolase fold domain-containing protein [Pseudoruegeria sp. SK021]OSP56187.1 alpha/beta hydrolase [Pseudoruegeria sp. SK021]